MNDEITRTLNQETAEMRPAEEQKNSTVERVAAATIGAAIGSGAVYAAGRLYDKDDDNADAPQTETKEDIPTGADAIVATDEGVRVAHVDDALSFDAAFAAARQQVGAGGLFEWHGKVYGTYYKQEWDTMSQEARSQWQSKVDYADVTDEPINADSHGHSAPTNTHKSVDIADDATSEISTVVADEADNEVHVVGIAVKDNGQGGMATLAGIQIGDETAIVVDLETDGTIDIIGVDSNNNGTYEQGEWHDASEANMSTSDVIGAYMAEADEQGAKAIITNLDDGSQYAISGGTEQDGCGYMSTDDSSVGDVYDTPTYEA